MTKIWARVLAKAVFWLVAEIALSCIGLDDLADYGEFVFEKNLIVRTIQNDQLKIRALLLAGA